MQPSPRRWFDHVTLSPMRADYGCCSPTYKKIQKRSSLPSLNRVEDLFASVTTLRSRLRPLPKVDPREKVEKIRVQEENSEKEKAKRAIEEAEKAKKRARVALLRERKRKRKRWLQDKKEAENERQRHILELVENKTNSRRLRSIRNDVTKPSSPFSRHQQKKTKIVVSKKEKNEKQHEFKDLAAHWNDLGDPYGCMRKSIIRRTFS